MSRQAVTLLFAERPSFDFSDIARRAEEIAGEKFDFPHRGDSQASFQIFHKQHLPSLTAFFTGNKKINVENYRSIIEQSWGCKNVEELISSAGYYSLLMMEMMADGLEPQIRLSLFHHTLQATLEIAPPQVILFEHSQQAIEPAEYLACCDLEPILRPGAINVRFFNIANSEGEMLMDTRGMEEIGLHDFQCHFRQLDPNDVIGVLANTAIYIAQNGAVIESGHTIAGVAPGSRWSCQFEESLVEPQRVLLDVNPGADFAAGRT
ncbi:DUF4261 domain-containing protein [Chamaesiphon polymorphus]|uniref:DUF4261 domain-containing protein n=1 Tax=Chamaesiphon polymorphus CCALA 037 TaxID=2107692 RepID=A0A2T1GGW7_9CYAN|nr:DUF4261 domain-containing protein [Chamaesiphon polymorphus]PSB56772.1 hypothetical protein C7B77_10660 [Chamaesiphon polymorphus CCALA 037]